jgi:integrase
MLWRCDVIRVREFLASFPFAETTKRTYANVLLRFLAECVPADLSAAGLIEFVSKPEWGSSRRCVALAACQRYLAWKYGGHPALMAKLKRVAGKPQRALSADVALRLLASFDPYTAKGARDLAIASVALDTGLRCSELCRLQQADTDLHQRVLQVIVKGGQWSAAVFSPETAENIARWLRYRKVADGQGFLFTNVFTGDGLTPEGLYSIVREWGRKIGIKLCVHDLRRTFAVLATENGAPERVLMEGGRWNNSEMIHRYTRTLKLDSMRQYLPVSKLLKDL